MYLLSLKKNHDHKCQFSPKCEKSFICQVISTYEKSLIHELSSKLQDKKQVCKSKLNIAEVKTDKT